jgi:DNA-binding response OmpR family regulator
MIQNTLNIDVTQPGVAFYGDAEIVLTRNEYRVLALLLDGKVATRPAILTAIGNASDMKSRTVDMTMSRLKRKIKGMATIQSIRGFGYRLKAI